MAAVAVGAVIRVDQPAARCDICRRGAFHACAGCELDLCSQHSYAVGYKIYCGMCTRRLVPRCADCNADSEHKCSLCPQRLCRRCMIVCEEVHGRCKQRTYCRDCAKPAFERCGVCSRRACRTARLQCHACRTVFNTCGSCVRRNACQCAMCTKFFCARCIGPRCNVCGGQHCTGCVPGAILPRCMAPACLQPVCFVCSLDCSRCNATTCSSHTPAPSDTGACPACQFGTD